MLGSLVSRPREELAICGRGASIGTPDAIRDFPTPGLDLPLVDTNGAGDALAVGFLASYVLEGRSLKESVERGQVSARWNCAQRASSSTLVTAEQWTTWCIGRLSQGRGHRRRRASGTDQSGSAGTARSDDHLHGGDGQLAACTSPTGRPISSAPMPSPCRALPSPFRREPAGPPDQRRGCPDRCPSAVRTCTRESMSARPGVARHTRPRLLPSMLERAPSTVIAAAPIAYSAC
jgi:hypothetical protein